MDIILKQDIPNLGHKDDIVTVKPGYARNYLIPKGMAIAANETNRKVLAEIKRQRSFKDEKILDEAKTLAKALENTSIKIGAKAGTSGKIFGSVNAIQIASALKEKTGFDIDRKMVHVDGESIKELGSYKAKVKLHRDVEVEINFEVVEE